MAYWGTPASVGAGVAKRVAPPSSYYRRKIYRRQIQAQRPRRRGFVRKVGAAVGTAGLFGAIGLAMGGPVGLAIGAAIGALGGASDD